jgi:hypothetical protein
MTVTGFLFREGLESSSVLLGEECLRLRIGKSDSEDLVRLILSVGRL